MARTLITRSIVAAVIGAALLAPGAAGATDASSAGWWTRSPVAVAPDGQGALVVQGGPQADQPVSYAAVKFTLGPGESAARLILTVAPNSASTPSSTLAVCPLTGSFAPADGGSIADAPPYDCKTTAAAAVSGGRYTFDVSSFTANGTLAVAVLPSAAGDRVILAKPSGDALQTTSEASAASDSSTIDAQPVTSGDSGGGTFVDTSPLPIPTLDVPVTPPAPARATSRSVDSGLTGALPAVATTNGSGDTPAAPIIFVLLAVIAAGLWLAAGHVAGDAEPVTHD